MFPAQTPKTDPDEFSRCEGRGQPAGRGISPGPIQEADAVLQDQIYGAIWKDDVLRAIEYNEMDVLVKNRIVLLSGHIVNTASQNRIINAIQTVSGISEIRNQLVLDDGLTLEVAGSLGRLEHTYGCKFYTGSSHGVVSLNGLVSDENVRALAEQCAASNPHVRGVINHVRVSGTELGLQEQPFLQPTIGEIIYFLDGFPCIVKQVIMDPNNRRVVAMIVRGQFGDQMQELKSMNDAEARSPERLVVLSMDLVRYLTKVSGFLYINSNERKRNLDFDPGSFCTPNWDWTPPYPYCPADVLFPIEQQDMENQIMHRFPDLPFAVSSTEELLQEQLPANDSLGG